MKKFVCEYCNYRFNSDKEEPKCPYCEKQKPVGKELNASDLVNNA